MSLRKIIHLLIAFALIGWWLGTFLFQLLDIYPYNNLILSYSSLGLIALTFLLAIHDLIVFKSLEYFMDFFPDTKGEFPTLEEWASARVWKSLPQWVTACTVFWVLLTYSTFPQFSFPSMNSLIKEYINNDSLSSSRIGEVKGFSFYKGGSGFSSIDTLPMELTIRVYGSKGNFPLEVTINKKSETYNISKLLILK